MNLAGIVGLKTPNGFTGNNWVITDGQVTTTSTSTFTVPGYPVSNQLLSLGITVDIGLAILQGDPITIRDAGGNVSLVGYVLSYTANTGALVVQIGVALQLEIRNQDHHGGGFGDDYNQWYDWGGGQVGGDAPLIVATLGGGLTIVDLGFVLINIPVLTMQRLRLRSYLIGLVATDSVSTRQIFLGKLPVLYGGIAQLISTGVAPTQSTVLPPTPPVSGPSDNIPAGVP